MKRLHPYLNSEFFETLDFIPAAIVITDMDKKVIHTNKSFNELFSIQCPDETDAGFIELLEKNSPDYQNSWFVDSHHLEVCIKEQKYNFIISGTNFGEEIIMRVIQDITKVVVKLGALQNEVEAIKHKLKNIEISFNSTPMCTSCNKIRFPDGSWKSASENSNHLISEAGLSHSICPACTKKYLKKLI